jgi:hypothetical protein
MSAPGPEDQLAGGAAPGCDRAHAGSRLRGPRPARAHLREPCVLSLPNTTVDSAAENSSDTVSRPRFPPVSGLPAFCDVQLTVISPGFHHQVNIEVWLPTSNVERRFRRVGGGGYAAGFGLPFTGAGPLKAGLRGRRHGSRSRGRRGATAASRCRPAASRCPGRITEPWGAARLPVPIR